MELFSLTVGSLAENVYFLVDDQRETIIFDPGDQAEEIQELIDGEALKPIAIVLTHAHSDHIGAVEALRRLYGIPVYLNRLEADFLGDPVLNLSQFSSKPVICTPADGYYPEEMGEWQIGSFKPRLVQIPGHSPGSTVFLFEENGFVIGGDVLFKGSVGRSDFPGGSHQTLMDGIREHLLSLPGETVIFPGHGEPTTIQEEIQTNPYLNGKTR